MRKKQDTLFPSMEEMLEDQRFAGRPALSLIQEIQSLYLLDEKPWIIGYSGGKDSTVILSLIYVSLTMLPKQKRHKHIYVISSDTLVETPVVVDLVKNTIAALNEKAQQLKLPLSAHQVYPRWDQTFWVNLLGKGYPAPTQNFRWCTERMKIDPISDFVKDKVTRFGEVIIVLGARREESASRAQVIARHRIEGSLLSRHTSLAGAFTYMPIADWSFDEVWMYLLGAPSPWGGDHFALFELYKDSNAGECPLVIDTNTPSCGNSRFGCWTCTVVTKDRAIEGLIESGEVWLSSLKKFRDKLYSTTDPAKKEKYRNFKRRTGKVHYLRGDLQDDQLEVKNIPGPYWMTFRKELLDELLKIQKELKAQGHDLTLIHPEELYAIRREWMFDPNEPDWSDSLPAIYRAIFEDDLDWADQDSGSFTESDAELLKELESQYDVPAELVMKLIELEQSMDGLSKRVGLFKKIETLLKQDWGSLEEIKSRKKKSEPLSLLKNRLKFGYEEQLKILSKEYEKIS